MANLWPVENWHSGQHAIRRTFLSNDFYSASPKQHRCSVFETSTSFDGFHYISGILVGQDKFLECCFLMTLTCSR